MKKEYTIRQSSETTWWYEFTEPNAKGETLVIELNKDEDCSSKNSLPKLWKREGFLDRILETYWSINTYVTDTEGNQWIRYNPQIKFSEDEKRIVINFDWIFEATEENKEKLINEVYKLWSSAKGETATDKKLKKVKEYAEQHNIEIVTEMPEGWFKIETMTAPAGSTLVSNMKLNLKSFRDKNRKEVLLLV